MNTHEFRGTLERALSGDRTALEAILLLYMPLVNYTIKSNTLGG